MKTLKRIDLFPTPCPHFSAARPTVNLYPRQQKPRKPSKAREVSPVAMYHSLPQLTSGSFTVKVTPRSWVRFSTVSEPFCCCTILWLMANPRPVLYGFVV